MTDALRKVIKRKHYPLEVMLTCVAQVLGLAHSKFSSFTVSVR
ncbi:hypothetical protein AB4Z46_28205 [Variovorax sp. M-6]